MYVWQYLQPEVLLKQQPCLSVSSLKLDWHVRARTHGSTGCDCDQRAIDCKAGQAWPVEQELPWLEMKGRYKAFSNAAHVPDGGKPEEELKASWKQM